MKLIGRGWQYSVYDLGNGRVLKRYNNVLIGFWVMFKTCFPFKSYSLLHLPKFYKHCKQFAMDSLEKVRSSNIDYSLLGNPKFLHNLDYEQDKLQPLHVYFESCSYDDGCKKIDEFIALNSILIQKGLLDKSFNIGKNFALNSSGHVVLSDIGELLSDPEKIAKQMSNRVWSKHYVLEGIVRSDLEQYFINEMDKNFYE